AHQALAVFHDTDIYHVQRAYFVVGDTVRVDSVVVEAIDLKPTTYALMIEERAGGPYSGIMAYLAGTRPDTLLGGIHIGDMITVQGVYTEYTAGSTAGTVSEIDYCTVTMVHAGYGEVPPQHLSCRQIGEILADSVCAEQWEGVFVEVDTVKCVQNDLAYAEWRVSDVNLHAGACRDTVRIDDKLVDPTLSRPAVGDTLALIRGPLSYEFDQYRIWPRADSDVVYISTPPGPNLILAYPLSNTKIEALFDKDLLKASAETKANYYLNSGTSISAATQDVNNAALVHLTTATQPATQTDILTACDVKSGIGVPMDSCETYSFRAGITPISFIQTPAAGRGDTSQCYGQQVTTTGIVTSSNATFGGPYFMQKRSGGPWNGIYVYQFTMTNLNPGDSVVVSGIVTEYYGATEFTSLDYQQRIPVAAPVKIKKVSPSMIVAGSPTAESYEGAMVRVDSCYIYQGLDTHNEWRVGLGTDSVWVAHRAAYTYVPTLGCKANVQGPLDYYYGYAIQPRTNADITEFGAGVTPGTATLRLAQNAPNPFGRETAIKFTVPTRMKVSLSVYDVSGRMVRSVFDAVADPGEHSAKWDGRDGSGTSVSPGVYFIKMMTPQQSIEKKMVLVK
ncbi:MAG TPA: FlgD immunoglobulin-like domain containing protein, partial [bacterium]|nr:FlgD immunoglobulin-like domain containing protein [bacterium]